MTPDTYKYVEAPKREMQLSDWTKTIFLAGSISGALDWQKHAAEKLIPHFHVFNPRRENYKMFDPKVEHEQISWEHFYLNACQIIMFNFRWETVAPITLLEYGAALESTKVYSYQKIYTCISPEYQRKNDVIIQTELRNPRWSRNIRFSLDETIQQIIEENT